MRTANAARWLGAGLWIVACATPLERGERLYRQGDLPGALEEWRGAPEDPAAAARLTQVVDELERRLRRYEKQARFFEEEERLGEAILYYRLVLKLDPDRDGVLDRVQVLARRLEQRVRDERAALAEALEAGHLRQASAHAQALAALDPFDPTSQSEATRVRAAVGAEVLRNLESGKQFYARGDRSRAREAFEAVLALEETNQIALGYLAYIRRFEGLEAQQQLPLPPRAISQEEILAEGHYRAARRAREAGDDFQALAEYRAALRVNSEHRRARGELESLRSELLPRVEELYEIGIRYFQDEDLHNALRVWRQVLLIDPRHSRTRENLNRAERILSRLEELQTGGS